MIVFIQSCFIPFQPRVAWFVFNLLVCALLVGSGASTTRGADEPRTSDAVADGLSAEHPLDVAEARRRVGEKVWVKVLIKSTKDRLEKRGEIYLDAEFDFRDPMNLAIVISRNGARSLQDKGIDDPAEHFRDKTVLVNGKVAVQDDVPRIIVDEASQIRVLDP